MTIQLELNPEIEANLKARFSHRSNSHNFGAAGLSGA